MNKTIARIGAIAALALVATAAFAFYDQQILIDRALNSPTITVRYSGARAAFVEFKLNGVSLGTRTVSSAKTSGETNFTLDLKSLSDGDNLVEIRLYDKNSKLIGAETTVITSEDDTAAPVRMMNPKIGATVQGGVDIKVGFGKDMRNAYVSFFVDNQFKSMTNVSPFSFLWDTTRESNGWHELEAMLVDDSAATFKTRKIRVLVNNPGGRTDRVTTPEPGNVVAPKPDVPTVKNTATKTGTIVPIVTKTITNVVPPKVAGTPVPNGVKAQIGERTGVKAAPLEGTSQTGSRVVTPGTPTLPKTSGAKTVKSPVVIIRPSVPSNTVTTAAAAAATSTTGATPKVAIEKGTRLPATGNFKITYNAKPISFDVQPRFEDGVALAPVRHLFENAGGKVDWDNQAKIVNALAEGKTVRIAIGDKVAKVGDLSIQLEKVPFLENGRTIIPISFLHDTFNVNIEYDAKTGMVLITKAK